jgi:DNA-binding NarL/FixJ family response regulator
MKSASATPRRIRIAILESDPIRQVGWREVFSACPEFEVVCPAELAEPLGAVDVVVLGRRHGVTLTESIARARAWAAHVPVLATGEADEQTAISALTAGAKGFIAECEPPAQLLKAIQALAEGSAWADGRVIAGLIDALQPEPSAAHPVPDSQYTARERQVLAMLVNGMPNREIGFALGIEARTVKAHIAKLMRKAGVNNRTALAVHALQKPHEQHAPIVLR